MPVPNAQLHQPRVAEIVADVLRQRILSGEIEDGGSLPNQEQLLEDFAISKPSLREALRILETEGLITVRRGSIGGATIHRPEARQVAYTLALVLQGRNVAINDVAIALKQLEGMCAGLAAGRDDRLSEVIPFLNDSNDRAAAALDDPLLYVEATADFHRALVDRCGNDTMRLIAGSLEAVWLSHVQEWAESTSRSGTFPDRAYRQNGLKAHERITRLIEKGDVARVTRLAEDHFNPDQFYSTSSDGKRLVSASVLRTPVPSVRGAVNRH